MCNCVIGVGFVKQLGLMCNTSPCFPFAFNIALGWRWMEESRGAVKCAEISQPARNALDFFCSKMYDSVLTELAQIVIFEMHTTFSVKLGKM